jgi:hypothetical protein
VTAIRQVVGAIGALAVLAACGGGSGSEGSDSADSDFAKESASAIEKASTTDMKAIKAVHIVGELSQQAGEVSLDISLTTEGDCTGTFSPGDGSAEVVSLDGTSWFKPDEEFWQAQAGPQAEQIISTVGDDWVQLPEGDASFLPFCDLEELLDQIDDADADTDKPSKKGETEDVDGQEAIKLTGKKEDGGTTTVWVAVDDPHHILKVEREGGDSSGSLTFSEFDQDVSVAAPAADEVITFEELQQQAQQ